MPNTGGRMPNTGGRMTNAGDLGKDLAPLDLIDLEDFQRKDTLEAGTHRNTMLRIIIDSSHNSEACSDIANVDYGKYAEVAGPELQLRTPDPIGPQHAKPGQVSPKSGPNPTLSDPAPDSPAFLDSAPEEAQTLIQRSSDVQSMGAICGPNSRGPTSSTSNSDQKAERQSLGGDRPVQDIEDGLASSTNGSEKSEEDSSQHCSDHKDGTVVLRGVFCDGLFVHTIRKKSFPVPSSTSEEGGPSLQDVVEKTAPRSTGYKVKPVSEVDETPGFQVLSQGPGDGLVNEQKISTGSGQTSRAGPSSDRPPSESKDPISSTPSCSDTSSSGKGLERTTSSGPGRCSPPVWKASWIVRSRANDVSTRREALQSFVDPHIQEEEDRFVSFAKEQNRLCTGSKSRQDLGADDGTVDHPESSASDADGDSSASITAEGSEDDAVSDEEDAQDMLRDLSFQDEDILEHQMFKVETDHLEDSYDRARQYVESALDTKGVHIRQADFTMDLGTCCAFDGLSRFLEANYLADPDCHVINDRTHTGKDCVSIVFRKGEKIVRRYKFYNKLAQCWQTQNNTTTIGTHIHTLLFPYNEQMRETYARAQPFGWCRVECTFYDVTEFLDFEAEVLAFRDVVESSGCLFECSVADQWKAFAEHLTRSIVVISKTTREVAVGLWCNTDTRRIGGALTKIDKETDITSGEFRNKMAAKYSYRNGGVVSVVYIEELDKADARAYAKTKDEERNHPTTMTVKPVVRHVQGFKVFAHPKEAKVHMREWGYLPQPNVVLAHHGHWDLRRKPVRKVGGVCIILGAPLLDWDKTRDAVLEAEMTVSRFRYRMGSWAIKLVELPVDTKIRVQVIVVMQTSTPPYRPFVTLVQAQETLSFPYRVLASNAFITKKVEMLLAQRALHYHPDEGYLTSKTGCWIFEFVAGPSKEFVIDGKKVRGAKFADFRINPQVYTGDDARKTDEQIGNPEPEKLLACTLLSRAGLLSVDHTARPGGRIKVRSMSRISYRARTRYLLNCRLVEEDLDFNCICTPHLTKLLDAEYERLMEVGNMFELSVGAKMPAEADGHRYCTYVLHAP
ncbi:hypothetical protein BDK51DRAFT_51980 [Blyttiomyces helicus]|uniref:Uncharacterized protein n=1 Tax=Blyttiomyces helicus TaxID=388810 RepID=A0A4P9WHV6_9FUNG|nr:hypothetical protein BDK51DRAFT_51980 [Blyttiomyces helicus]|eukprot:RKO91433.1 hypothetical protein BDK51DRAFT_51980 [Blyttiomyces helicus]